MIQSLHRKALITATVDRPPQAQLGRATVGGILGIAAPLHPALPDGIGTVGKVVGLTAQPDLRNGTAMQRVNMTTTTELQQDEEC